MQKSRRRNTKLLHKIDNGKALGAKDPWVSDQLSNGEWAWVVPPERIDESDDLLSMVANAFATICRRMGWHWRQVDTYEGHLGYTHKEPTRDGYRSVIDSGRYMERWRYFFEAAKFSKVLEDETPDLSSCTGMVGVLFDTSYPQVIRSIVPDLFESNPTTKEFEKTIVAEMRIPVQKQNVHDWVNKSEDGIIVFPMDWVYDYSGATDKYINIERSCKVSVDRFEKLMEDFVRKWLVAKGGWSDRFPGWKVTPDIIWENRHRMVPRYTQWYDGQGLIIIKLAGLYIEEINQDRLNVEIRYKEPERSQKDTSSNLLARLLRNSMVEFAPGIKDYAAALVNYLDSAIGATELLTVSKLEKQHNEKPTVRRGGPIPTSEEEKQRIVEEWFSVQGNESQEIFCNRKGIGTSTLRTWIRELRAKDKLSPS